MYIIRIFRTICEIFDL